MIQYTGLCLGARDDHPLLLRATPDLMAQELGVKAELDKLALVLAPED